MKYRKLLESMETKYEKDMSTRRYNLSEIISESYRVLYACEQGSNLQKVVESHLTDVRRNPADMERLSRQLSTLKHIVKMVESKKLEDEELLVPEEKYTPVEPKEEKVEESVQEDKMTPEEMKDYWEKNKDNDPVLSNYDSFDAWYKDSKDNGYVEEDPEDEDLLEDTDLTDDEVEELAKHLSEIRKNKKVAECDDPEAPVKESKGRKLMRRTQESKEMKESKTWSDIKEGLKNFSKESSSKAFYKTFKKMSDKLQEGAALTRQESIALYKASNSAMTHLSVELEHNPEFLSTFNESVSLLAEDVAKVLGSLKNNKAPSKSTMKSLAKFAEALLYEDEEEDEELPPIEDEEFIDNEEEAPAEEEVVEEESSEVEEFDQEYADARVELHKEMVDDHVEDEDPEVQDRIAQDAAEIMDLPGVTDEQIAEITGEEVPPAEEQPEEEAPAEEPEEELEETEDEEITDDELAELKKHLMEMRKAKQSK